MHHDIICIQVFVSCHVGIYQKLSVHVVVKSIALIASVLIYIDPGIGTGLGPVHLYNAF